MLGWLARLRAEFRAEYERALAEHRGPAANIGASTAQSVQGSVDITVWHARGCGLNGVNGGHDLFDENCTACWELTHCTEHDEFTQFCLGCERMKDPEVRGTVAHRHRDPAKQADEGELGKGRVIWRD